MAGGDSLICLTNRQCVICSGLHLNFMERVLICILLLTNELEHLLKCVLSVIFTSLARDLAFPQLGGSSLLFFKLISHSFLIYKNFGGI